jgi:hypothetical protein
MKSILYRLIYYPLALIFLIILIYYEAPWLITKNTPFFLKDFGFYYLLGLFIIIDGLLEKSNSKKLDENLLLKILICVISLLFFFLGYKFTPESENFLTFNGWMDYVVIIFAGSIWIGLYFQMLTKNERKKDLYSDDLWKKLEYWGKKLDIGQKVNINKNCSIERKENPEAKPFNITLEISLKGEISTWGWTFESKNALTHFEPSDKFYSGTEKYEYPDEYPNLYFLHKAICK